MDMISEYVDGKKSARITTYNVWQLMRINKESPKAAVLVRQEEKPRFIVAKMHRQLIDLRTTKAKQLLQRIMYDLNNAIEQMEKMVEAFWNTISISTMLINQFKNIISASERGIRYHDKMLDYSNKAMSIDLRISHNNQNN
jgi:hypothetical protein